MTDYDVVVIGAGAAGLAVASGERPIDTEWLRIELGLTAPLSERLP